MILRICSDLHLEFMSFDKLERLLNMYLPPDDRDKDSILLLAGDCMVFEHYKTTGLPLFRLLSKRFKQVIKVLGNHTWYGGTWWNNYKSFWSERLLPKNVTILDRDYIIIGDVAFIGATLWTSMNNRDPITMFHCERAMNDYNLIKYQAIPDGPYGSATVRISAESTVTRHEEDVAFIKSALNALRNTVSKHIVITHHMPSFQSVDPIYAGDMLNHAFASDLDELILTYQPQLFVHGHTHSSCDYMIDNTRVICNPLGYHSNQLNKNYNKALFLEI